MPYAYYFARTYTFVYPLLSEADREKCRAVMKIRGDEMYGHPAPRGTCGNRMPVTATVRGTF